jgi:hypothetical protein
LKHFQINDDEYGSEVDEGEDDDLYDLNNPIGITSLEDVNLNNLNNNNPQSSSNSLPNNMISLKNFNKLNASLESAEKITKNLFEKSKLSMDLFNSLKIGIFC